MNTVDLETRVQFLERRLNRYRLTTALAGLAFVAVVCIAAEAPKGVADEVRTKRLVVVDDQGKHAAHIDAGRYGGVLRLLNLPGQTVVILGAGENGGRLMVADNMGKDMVKVDAVEEGGQVQVLNNKGQKQVLSASTPK